MADAAFQARIARQVGSGKKVLIRGVSYKPGVKNLEHSIALDLVKALELSGNTVLVEDPLFSPEELADLGIFPFRVGLDQPELILERHTPLEGLQKSKGGAD